MRLIPTSPNIVYMNLEISSYFKRLQHVKCEDLLPLILLILLILYIINKLDNNQKLIYILISKRSLLAII